MYMILEAYRAKIDATGVCEVGSVGACTPDLQGLDEGRNQCAGGTKFSLRLLCHALTTYIRLARPESTSPQLFCRQKVTQG